MGRTVIRTLVVSPIVLGAVTATSVAVAALLGRPVWAAALGAGLMLAYWGLEVFAWRLGEASRSFSGAMGIALGGMVARLLLVVGALALVGVFAQPAFSTAAFAFLAAFTLYLPMRLLGYQALSTSPPHAGAS